MMARELFTMGAAIDLRLAHVFADYNFASQSALAVGVGIGSFR